MAHACNKNVLALELKQDDNSSDSMITNYDETEFESVPVDFSITSGSMTLLMRSYFDFIYAKALGEVMNLVRKKHCHGCTIDHPSQKQHTCLTDFDDDDKECFINFYFDSMLQDVDESDILKSWEDVMKISNISSELMELHKMAISSKDFLETMKTEQWKRKMKKMVLTIIHLENRLFRV